MEDMIIRDFFDALPREEYDAQGEKTKHVMFAAWDCIKMFWQFRADAESADCLRTWIPEVTESQLREYKKSGTLPPPNGPAWVHLVSQVVDLGTRNGPAVCHNAYRDINRKIVRVRR